MAIVDKAALKRLRDHSTDKAAMISYFDGSLPTWPLILARGMNARRIVERVVGRLRAVHDNPPKPTVVLLTGAGGEGKSTAILQIAATLVAEEDQQWTCLHRYSTAATLPENLFERLPAIAGHVWIVLIDDADNVGTSILSSLSRLGPRTDVHFLLASRDAEWQLKRLVPGMWQPVADFHPESLIGVDDEDARRIVAGWRAWGDEAMGLLHGQSEERAAVALAGHAREFAARPAEGALLGALLITRQGEDMRTHVRTLVNGLSRRRVLNAFSLLDIYAMVAAMHAENLLYLSRWVLARGIGCEIDDLERVALNVLRLEAMLDSGDTYVLTRHRRIAETACAVLREDGYDVDRWYAFLARSALIDFKRNLVAIIQI